MTNLLGEVAQPATMRSAKANQPVFSDRFILKLSPKQASMKPSLPVRAKGLRESALPGLARASEIDHGGIG